MMPSTVLSASARNIPRQLMRHQRQRPLVSVKRSRNQCRYVSAAVASQFQGKKEGRNDGSVSGLLGLVAVATSAAWIADKKAKCFGMDIIPAGSHTLDLPWTPEVKVTPSGDSRSHLTIKDVLGQPESIARALGFGSRLSGGGVRLGGLDTYLETMSGTSTTSSNAAKYATQIMRHLGSSSSTIAPSSAKRHSKKNGAGIFMVSQSGETNDLVRLVNGATDKDATTTIQSSESSSNSFATQVTVLALVALWFQQNRDVLDGASCSSEEVLKLKEALTRLPISFGMTKKSREQCKRVAKKMQDKERCFVLGRGFAEPVAMEGAWNLKEVSCLPAESCCEVFMGHQNNKKGAAPAICLILDDDHANHMRELAKEAKAKGADLTIITDKKCLAADLDEDPIVLQQNGPMTALGAALPLQLIAYELSLLKGISSDMP